MAKPNKTTSSSKKHTAHLQKVRRQSKIIQYTAIGIFALVVVLLVVGFISQTGFPPYRNVARVNGDNISRSLFVTRAKMQVLQLTNQQAQLEAFAQAFGVDPTTDPSLSSQYSQILGMLNNKESLGQQVLDTLVDEALIRQEADKRGLAVSEDEISTAMQEAFNYYPDGTPTPAPTATEFVQPTLNPTQLAFVTITPTASPFPTPTADLSATPTATLEPTATNTAGPSPTAQPTATAYTQAGFEQQLKETRDNFSTQTGLTEEEFRALFVNTLLREKLQDEITADTTPSQEQVWAQHILVATEDEANAVLDRLNAGEDWNTLAAELSTDTSNKDNGGDLGWFGHGAMVTEFEDAAFALKVGAISEPVKTSFGYHIIRVLGHEDRPLSDADFQQAKDTAFNTWLEDARARAKIKIYAYWKNLDFTPSESSAQ
jgi:parvulin-like peptidyl-prolyl isomerase